MKNNRLKKLFDTLFAAVLLAAVLTGCGKEQPPDDGSPSPEPLNGVFSGEYGELKFNGDGKTIELNVTDEFAELNKLPGREGSGTYVFMFDNGSWRYDLAEDLRITLDGKDHWFNNCVGKTDSDTVAFYLPYDSSKEFVFEKQGTEG